MLTLIYTGAMAYRPRSQVYLIWSSTVVLTFCGFGLLYAIRGLARDRRPTFAAVTIAWIVVLLLAAAPPALEGYASLYWAIVHNGGVIHESTR